MLRARECGALLSRPATFSGPSSWPGRLSGDIAQRLAVSTILLEGIGHPFGNGRYPESAILDDESPDFLPAACGENLSHRAAHFLRLAKTRCVRAWPEKARLAEFCLKNGRPTMLPEQVGLQDRSPISKKNLNYATHGSLSRRGKPGDPKGPETTRNLEAGGFAATNRSFR